MGCRRTPGSAGGRAFRLQLGGDDTCLALDPQFRSPELFSATLRPSVALARLLGSTTIDGFRFNRAELLPHHETQIAVLAETLVYLMRDYPTGVVIVTGHADAPGGEAINMEIGMQRAVAVSQALRSAGVPAGSVLTRSRGESELRFLTQGREPANRRVEVEFQPEPLATLRPTLQMPSGGRALDLRVRPTGNPRQPNIFGTAPPPITPRRPRGRVRVSPSLSPSSIGLNITINPQPDPPVEAQIARRYGITDHAQIAQIVENRRRGIEIVRRLLADFNLPRDVEESLAAKIVDAIADEAESNRRRRESPTSEEIIEERLNSTDPSGRGEFRATVGITIHF